jgi:gliding motility-associated-like protein
MIKCLRSIVSLLMLIGLGTNCYAQFPYIESFRNANANGITFGGAPSAFLTAAGSGYENGSHVGAPIDPAGNGFLRLTSNANNQKGFAISNQTFPSTDGLSVEFEYYIYGGSGADGISFFLFDASANPFQIGSFGGSLGYAQTTFPSLTPGVSMGYLAIGLDEYGNFSNKNEGRQGGAPDPSFRPGSVTLRGKGNGTDLVPENYKYLTSAQENTPQFPFGLVGNGIQRTSDPANSGYRKVKMLLEPNALGGYNITVMITRGGSPQVSATVIDRYYYPEAAPSTLKYGFASSTGFLTNFHEVRNVTIDILAPITKTAPVANNDVAVACQNTQAFVNVASNDVTNNAGGVIDNKTLDLDPSTAGVQTTFTVPGRGVFAVTSDGFVQFTQSTPFIGSVATTYNIKDTYGVTSNNATITINYTEAPATPNAGTDQLINVSSTPTFTTLQASSSGANVGTWTQVSGPSVVVFANANSFTTTASNLIGGSYLFKWTVRSAGGCELFDEVQVNINHRPVASNDAITTNLNIDINIPVLNNDTDEDGNSTIQKNSISIKSQPQNGTLIIDNVTGIVTYKPNPGYSGFDSFVYTVKDIYGVESNNAIVTIAVNVKPVGIPDNSTTNAQTPVTIRVLDNDNSLPGTKVIKASEPTNGTVTLNADGTFVYTPNPNFSGTDTFTYKLVNKDGLESDPITVTVQVKPVGSDDVITTPTNTPAIILAKDNDLSKNGTTIVLTSTPFNGTVVLNSAGNPVYTPAVGFSGSDTFTYVLRTADGQQSNPITVTVRVKPVGSPDNVVTPFNTPITIPVKANDISKTGTTIISGTAPTRGTVSVDANGNMVYTPNSGFTGTDTYTYILRTADGIDSDPITVNVTVRTQVIIPAPNITTGATSGEPKIIDVPVPTGGNVVIVTAPKNGTITFDPLTGKPIYTPNPGYTGPDDFVYVIRDADGNQSTPGTVNVTVAPSLLPAKIGLAKALTKTTKNIDGTYDLTYTFTIVNSGEIALTNLSLTDDLSAAFPGAKVEVKRLVSLGSLIINSDFNGISNKEILASTSTMPATSKELIELTVHVVLGDMQGEFRNTAVVTGISVKTGLPVTDQSTNGLNPDSQTAGDFTPNEPTPVTLTKDGIKVPGGFSPNNDGINDLFVIENANNKQISLEVYNRWGNRIYKATTYQNTWNGKTTEGIHVGDDVPAGTYYYILMIDNKDKRVGYITINR